MKRLLVVEDDPGIRESLVDFLQAREFAVDVAEDAGHAQASLASGRYDAVLLDLRLPGGDGLDLLQGLRRRGDATPVLILTARGEEEQRVKGFELGADDYIVKPFSLAELHLRVEAVLRRSGDGADPLPARIGTAVIDLEAHEVRHGDRRHRLLQKEVELLAYLLRHPGRVLARDEILREVWGYESSPTTRTVDTHVFKLRQKIEAVPDRPRHIVTVHGAGYRLDL